MNFDQRSALRPEPARKCLLRALGQQSRRASEVAGGVQAEAQAQAQKWTQMYIRVRPAPCICTTQSVAALLSRLSITQRFQGVRQRLMTARSAPAERRRERRGLEIQMAARVGRGLLQPGCREQHCDAIHRRGGPRTRLAVAAVAAAGCGAGEVGLVEEVRCCAKTPVRFRRILCRAAAPSHPARHARRDGCAAGAGAHQASASPVRGSRAPL